VTLISLEQIVLVLTPPFLLLSTYFAYRFLAGRLGPRWGYLAGFLFYWLAWCLALPLVLLGPQGFLDLFRLQGTGLGDPWWLGLIALLIPLLLGYGYAFPQALGRRPGWNVLLASAILALINGTLEEVLWRGTYVAVFPNKWLLAILFPALGFGLWHLAPQAVHPNTAPGGRWSLVAVAAVMGLLWGWVAYSSGSIVWTTVSHILFDFTGLGGRLYLENRPLEIQ
jgi:uncharacterized protein